MLGAGGPKKARCSAINKERPGDERQEGGDDEDCGCWDNDERAKQAAEEGGPASKAGVKQSILFRRGSDNGCTVYVQIALGCEGGQKPQAFEIGSRGKGLGLGFGFGRLE